MILSCFRCVSNTGPGATFQNEAYGHGNRVHNETESPQPRMYRCTICKTERSAGKQS